MMLEDTSMRILTRTSFTEAVRIGESAGNEAERSTHETERVMMDKIVWQYICALLMVISVSARAEIVKPDVLIRNIAQEVLSIAKQDRGNRTGDKKAILTLVDAKVVPNFDFERMTQEAAGRGWRSATSGQKKALVSEFRKLVVNTYTNAFTRLEDQAVKVQPVMIPAGTDEVTVKTLITKPGSDPISVDYEMERTPEGWKAIDLIVEGASLVTAYRGTFDELVDQSGIDGLIKTLVEKNAANNAANNASR